jgi:thiamine biosynthesis lipoprotein
VHVRAGGGFSPAMEITDSAVASSATVPTAQTSQHLHGRERGHVVGARVVSVVAPRCIVADALTKVVLAADERCARVLAQFGALAGVNASGSWHVLGAAA